MFGMQSKFFVVDGVAVELIMDDVVILPSKDELKIIKRISMLGGFCAVRSDDPSLIEQMRNLYNACPEQPERLNVKVCVLKSFLEALSADEQEAILAHELAHIKNGDIDNESPNSKKMKVKIDYECERKADLAGAAKTSPETMLSVIHKLNLLMVENIFKVKKEGFLKKLLLKFTYHKVTKSRIQALEADIAAKNAS